MKVNLKNQIEDFMDAYPQLQIKPFRQGYTEFEGVIQIKHKMVGFEKVEDTVVINLIVPNNFPIALPSVREVSNKIPKTDEFHINSFAAKYDKTGNHHFCLGSDVRIKHTLGKKPTIKAFVKLIVEPWIYSALHKKEYGGLFPIGELQHGDLGLMDDYLDLFRVEDLIDAKPVFRALSLKKRIANKKPCPFGCGVRLGRCQHHHLINSLRNIYPRSFYRSLIENQ